MKNFKIIITASVVFVFCLIGYKLWDANNSLIPMSSSNGIHTFVATDTIARTPSGIYVYTQIVRLDDDLHRKVAQDGTPKEFRRTVSFMGSNKIFSVTLVSEDGWHVGRKYPILNKLNDPTDKEINFVRNYHKQHGDPNIFVKPWALMLAMWLMFGIAYYNFASKPTCKTTGEKLLVTGRVFLSLAIVVAIPTYNFIYNNWNNNWRNFHYSGGAPYTVVDGFVGIFIGIVLLLVLCWLCSFLPSRILKFFETDIEYKERLERERQALLNYMRIQKNIKRFGWPMLKIVTGTGGIFAAIHVLNAITQGREVNAFKAVSAALGIEAISDLTDTMDGVSDVLSDSNESVVGTNVFLADATANGQTDNIASPMTAVDTMPDTAHISSSSDVNNLSNADVAGVDSTVTNGFGNEVNVDGKSVSNSTVKDIQITDANDKSILTVKDGTIQNSEGNQLGNIYNKENSVVAEDMNGMPVGSTDGQFVYDEAHKPTAVVDHNSEVTTIHHSDGSVTNEHGGDIVDGKTGKVIGHIEKI